MTARLAYRARQVLTSPFADDVRAAWRSVCTAVGCAAVMLVFYGACSLAAAAQHWAVTR